MNTPDAIPADILVAAENALDQLLCNCKEAGDVRQDSIMDIARAILAERARAIAAIEARKYTEDQGIDQEMACFNDGCHAAIEAIRQPTGE